MGKKDIFDKLKNAQIKSISTTIVPAKDQTLNLDSKLMQDVLDNIEKISYETYIKITKIPTGEDLREWDDTFADRIALPTEFKYFEEFYKKPEYFDTFNLNFIGVMNLLLKKKGWDSNDFHYHTTLPYRQYYRLTEPGGPQPKVSTIVTICMAMEIGINLANRLLILAGRAFYMESEAERAYIDLINNHQGKSIAECNQILADKGIEKKYFLGDKKLPGED